MRLAAASRVLALGLAVCALAAAQGIITTRAGTDWVFSGNGKPGTDVPLGFTLAVAADPQGDVYVADQDNFLIVKLDRTGAARVLAGNGLSLFSGDGGLAVNASVSFPRDIAVDAEGNVYFTENNRIRKVTLDGVITTIAGNGRTGSAAGDGGPATSAPISPTGITIAPDGAIYFTESTHRVRKISPAGIISTVAGTGQAGSSGDGGPAVAATLANPYGIAVDEAGNVYIAGRDTNRIRKVTAADGVIRNFAGTGVRGFGGDGGQALNANLNLFTTSSIRFDSGSLYIVDGGNQRVRKVAPDGIISTIGGSGGSGYSGDGGPALSASFTTPSSIAIEADGGFLVADSGNARVRRLNREGIVSTAAGNGAFRAFPEGAPALNAFLFRPRGVLGGPQGSLNIADTQSGKVSRVSAAGTIVTVAGGGGPALGDPGPAVAAFLSTPTGLKFDANGNLYVTDDTNHRVRRITLDGIITTFAGGGCTFSGFAGDGGPATSACMNAPRGIDFDAAGNLYIADSNNHRIRRVTANGTISTFAGNGDPGFSGDNGQAVSASLNSPNAVAFDAAGNLYIADSGNRRIRRVSPDGLITTVAGTGVFGFSGDGRAAITAALRTPRGLCFDSGGNLFVSDEADHRIRRITPAGIISTVAGNGIAGFSGDGGSPTNASLNNPWGCAVDAAGNLNIADVGNDRIRVVTTTLLASLEVAPATLALRGRSGGSPVLGELVRLTSSISGIPFTVDVTTAAGGSWLRANPANGTAPATLEITADPTSLAPGVYRGTVNIVAASAASSTRSVAVTFTVEAADAARLGIELKGLSFSFTQRSGLSQSQLVVANRGSGRLTFTASATTTAGGAWLTVSPNTGSVTPTTPATLIVSANPSALGPGTYAGSVSIASDSNERIVLPVTMTISAIQQSILLSQNGLTFTAVAGGGGVPPQSFGILNTGQSIMNWSVRAATLSGGSNWLSVTPASGSTDAASLLVPLVDVGINATALPAGEYYGQVEVSAPGADNSPQVVSVVLSVLPPGSSPGPIVRPTGLIFTGVAAGTSPGSQDVRVSNLSASPTSYTSGRLTADGQNWFVHVPANATVPPTQPVRIVVQPDLTNLTPGIRRGVLTLLFQDGSSRTVNLLLVLAPGQTTSTKPFRADGCTPTRLLPVFTSLGSDFNAPAAWPIPVEARVVADCGSPMVAGSVVASFSNGDAPVSLVPLRDGRWSGTWQPRNSVSSQIAITLAAESPAQQVKGSVVITGGLQGTASPPLVASGGVVSAASLAPQAPLAPGAVVSIFGSRLSEGQGTATQLPLESEMAGTLVTIGGRAAPLYSTSDGQINALLPYGLAVNTRHQLLVRRGRSLGVPEAVTIAEAQPAIFTKSQSGKGQGVIVDLQNRYVEPGNAARVGDAVVVYCSGLGAVDTPVVAGAAAPASPLPRITGAFALTIGGVLARVTFAGLTPGSAGLYQVNAFVPEGVQPADDVPVVLTVAGQASPPVTMAVR